MSTTNFLSKSLSYSEIEKIDLGLKVYEGYISLSLRYLPSAYRVRVNANSKATPRIPKKYMEIGKTITTLQRIAILATNKSFWAFRAINIVSYIPTKALGTNATSRTTYKTYELENSGKSNFINVGKNKSIASPANKYATN
jgi:hypothetical protein